MKLSKPKKVLDLDDFLPAGGEDKFDMYYSQGDLNLDIFYEPDDHELGESRKRICFIKAKHFFKSPFPGFSFFTCLDDNDISLLNSIVEYGQSEMLEEVSKSLDGADYKHYRLFLHSSGVAIHVIAKSLKILV